MSYLPEKERIEKYVKDYYININATESADWKVGRLRKDMIAALFYAYGYVDPLHVEGIRQHIQGLSFKEQLKEAKTNQTRFPKLVVSIGAGRGDLESVLMYDGVEAIGIEPSKGACELYRDTMTTWAKKDNFRLINKGMEEGLLELEAEGIVPDTIMFIESIEHIRPDEFERGYEIIKRMLKKSGGIMIIVNYLEMHPITVADDWNHIREINDEVFNEISKDAKDIKLRLRSHLVLQF